LQIPVSSEIINWVFLAILAENLVGKAQFIFFSLENARFLQIWKWPSSIRYERIFQKIQ